MEKSSDVTSADYIIVGGGIAGCTLAARLQKRLRSSTILLIEAGQDPSSSPQAQSAAGAHIVRNSDLAWHLEVAPNPHLGGRGVIAEVGKALGGGGAINGGAWTRGPASDYDLWADMVKDASWNYEGMLPYFRMSETHHDKARNEKQHGYDGPLHTMPAPMNHPRRFYPLREPVRQAWKQAGVDYIGDGNNGHPLGLTDLEEAWVEGKRQFPSKVFDLSRVKILPETLVNRVTIEGKAGKLVATGIDLVDGRRISATKEVIVSSGVFHTPKILMLSGIGNRDVLAQHSIPTLVDNPEVGKGLSDHLAVGLTWKLRNPENGLAVGSSLLNDPSFFNGWPMDFIQFGQVSTGWTESNPAREQNRVGGPEHLVTA